MLQAHKSHGVAVLKHCHLTNFYKIRSILKVGQIKFGSLVNEYEKRKGILKQNYSMSISITFILIKLDVNHNRKNNFLSEIRLKQRHQRVVERALERKPRCHLWLVPDEAFNSYERLGRSPNLCGHQCKSMAATVLSKLANVSRS